ncbi:MAG TPA: helix-turn-helix transcriptional regulator [Methylomirabilota bacterium]|nr:helix-turn-helix transcriptional regulator [Methylomirabilota bacterium]
MSDPGRPLYLIGVVADMLHVHPQTLRLYERKGLVRPSRTVGRTRLYSAEDVDDVRRILRLTRDLGVNLAGVEIILRMRRQMLQMQKELEELASHGRQEGGADRYPEGAEASALVRVADRHLQKLDVL